MYTEQPARLGASSARQHSCSIRRVSHMRNPPEKAEPTDRPRCSTEDDGQRHRFPQAGGSDSSALRHKRHPREGGDPGHRAERVPCPHAPTATAKDPASPAHAPRNQIRPALGGRRRPRPLLRRLHARLRSLQGRQRRAPRPARAPHGGRHRHHRQGRPHQPRPRRAKRIVDDLALQPAAPAPRRPAPLRNALQHKAAFDAYVRTGDASRLRDLESKALSVGTGTDGGYLVPDELERAVNRGVRDISPIRAIAGIRQVSGSVYGSRSPSPAPRPAGSPRPPRGPRPPPTLAELAGCLPDHGALRHAGRDPGSCSTTPPSTSTSGSPTRCGTVRPAGRHRLRHRQRHRQAEGLPRLHQGRATPPGPGATSASSRPASTAPSPPPGQRQPGRQADRPRLHGEAGYRANGTFVFNRATQAAIRKLKDADGDYLWQPREPRPASPRC